MVTNGQIARELMDKGWEIRYRGGNSVCATPSDLDLIVADAPRSPGSDSSPSTCSRKLVGRLDARRCCSSANAVPTRA